MATKKPGIADLVSSSMDGRAIGGDCFPQSPAQPPAPSPAPRRQPITVRFDPGDYAALQHAAREQGTSAAALIRKAVKDIIKAERLHG
jgi:hypothetical protein